MFDIEAHIALQRRLTAQAYIRVAARLIADCPDPQRQWRAMAELRKLQKIAKGC